MKKNLILLSFIFSTTITAREITEDIAVTKTSFRSHVDSFLRINKNDKLVVVVAKKTERRGFNGCKMHRGTMSTKKCKVSKKIFTIPNLSLEGSDIVYDNEIVVTTCGFIKDSWRGRKVILNGKCVFSNIRKNGYTVTRFIVEE